MDNQFEILLKKAASLYVEREGEALLSEHISVVPEPAVESIRIKVRKRVFFESARRTAFWGLPVAACLLLAVFVARPFIWQTEPDTNPMLDTPEYQRVEISFISAKLPEGCILTKTDYDHGKTIYHIVNGRGNDIVLAVEQTDVLLTTDGFTLHRVNDIDAYVMERRDYNVLLAKSGDMQYTITNAFEADDLVEIARSIF